jgi:hypothetical protein
MKLKLFCTILYWDIISLQQNSIVTFEIQFCYHGNLVAWNALGKQFGQKWGIAIKCQYLKRNSSFKNGTISKMCFGHKVAGLALIN